MGLREEYPHGHSPSYQAVAGACSAWMMPNRRWRYPVRQHWREAGRRSEMKKRGLGFDIVTLSRRAVLTLILFSVVLRAQGQTLSLLVPPEVRSHHRVAALTLHAVRENDGRDSFAFNGQTVPPIIRVSPGDTLKITYVNNLPQPSGEQCSVGPCMNMTNLHFHGLGVSPKAPADDVLDMIAMPGQTLNYTVH